MENNISIRKVKSEDMEEVFILSNQDYVRKFSINKEKIKWDDHINWFNRVIQRDNCVFYVVVDEKDNFLGQIRFNIENNEAIVSISLSQLITGKGLSRPLLLKSIDNLFAERKDVNILIAYVSEDNIASLKLFEKAGFSLIGNKDGLLKFTYSREE